MLRQLPNRFFSTQTATPDIRKLVVFGSGLMGSGIAQVASQAGMTVTVVDTNQKALDKGLSTFLLHFYIKAKLTL
jgi:pyruvate/2-oxoglutarate dehydrogenase complex dihydrolipoamide dehydrogenase (E3) component